MTKPILRWVGGKSRLLPPLLSRVPEFSGRYFEPFFGGGALGLALASIKPDLQSYAYDANWELMNFYRCVKTDPAAVLQNFTQFANVKEDYLAVRAWDRNPETFSKMDLYLRAARFLFLNKASFQGLWRVNKNGQHNVPYGHRANTAVSLEEIQAFSLGIQRFEFLDYDGMDLTKEGDFVYFDPPYLATFSNYTSGGFGDYEHVQLRDLCQNLDQRGIKFMVSNADCERIRELYQGFNIDTIVVNQTVAAESYDRGKITEVIIRNYK